MKPMLFCAGAGLAFAAAAAPAPVHAAAAAAPADTAERPIKVMLKALPSDEGDFGIDWEAKFAKPLTPAPAGGPPPLVLAFDSQGIVALDKKENQHNSATAALKLKGGAWVPIRPAPPASPGGVPDLSTLDPAQAAELARQMTPPWTIFPQLEAVTETTQEFRRFNTGVGASLAFNTTTLYPVIDLIPRFLRYGPHAAHNGPRQPDLSVGYKYLRQGFTSALFPADSQNVSRGDVNFEWETGIFSEQRLAIRYNGYYLFSAKPEKYVDFVVVRVDLITLPESLHKGAISLKWTSGKLPPLYESGTSLGAGFSVNF